MNPVSLKYVYRENCANSKVRLSVGQLAVQARMSPHPLFSQAKQIQLKGDQFNTKCIQLLQNGSASIPIEKSKEFVKRCRDVFGLEIEFDPLQLSMSLMLNSNDEDSKILDSLEFSDLLSVVKLSFDKTGFKLHSKLLRKLKNYIKSSKRQAAQKALLEKIAKSYKQTQNLEDNQKQVYEEQQSEQFTQIKKNAKVKTAKNSEKIVKNQIVQNKSDEDQSVQFTKLKNKKKQQAMDQEFQQQSSQFNTINKNFRSQSNRSSNGDWEDDKGRKNKGRRNKKQYQQYGQQKGNSKRQEFSYSKERYDRGSSANKEKVDPKILLGITGDTQNGWRQRNRPIRVPARSNLTVDDPSYQKQIKKNITQPLQKQVFKKQIMKKQTGENKISQNKKSSKSSRPSSKQNLDDFDIKESKKKQNTQILPAREIDQGDVKILQDLKLTDNKQMKLIYIFPKYGINFDFKKLKQQFLIFINGSIWVKYKENTLTILKGDNGYVRDTKIDLLNDGFMAEGFTLKLNGNSNIQDGGDIIGSPNIQQFTGTQSQFFHVITLEVYVPK